MTKISSMMEQVNVRGPKIQLPPPINPSQSPLCKSFLLQTMSDTLLTNPSLSPMAVAQVLGSRSCCDVIQQGLVLDIEEMLNDHWKNPANFEIRGFHGINGSEVQGCTIDSDKEVLKDVGDPSTDIALADRRSAGLLFCNVGLTCDLQKYIHKSLKKGGANTKMSYSGFIELPQSTVNVQTGGGASVNLTTFHGISKIKDMPAHKFKRDILDETMQPALLALDSPSPFVSVATRDYDKLNAKSRLMLLRLSCQN